MRFGQAQRSRLAFTRPIILQDQDGKELLCVQLLDKNIRLNLSDYSAHLDHR